MSKAQTPNLVKESADGDIQGFRFPDFQYTALGRIILFRLIHDRDIKVIITSSGSTTGTGKTTLAIHLCRWIRQVANELFNAERNWKADTGSFVDLNEYFQAYQDASKGDPLLMDEIEYAADRRRAMSSENVKLSQAWAILRYKNVPTISTLPTVSMLEGRLLELGDIWINVIHPGRANTYYLTVDDFDGSIIRKRLRMKGYRETIEWSDLQNDEDYNYLKGEKGDIGIPGLTDTEQISQEDMNEMEREVKRQVICNLLTNEDVDMTQAEIGDVVGYSQQNVYKIKRDYL